MRDGEDESRQSAGAEIKYIVLIGGEVFLVGPGPAKKCCLVGKFMVVFSRILQIAWRMQCRV